MRNKLVLISLLLAVAVTATAQTKEKYYSEHFKDNIFVSVGFGAQACVNPDNFDYGFSHAVTPVITLSVGKYFSPIWGVRLQGAGAWTTLYSKYYVTDYATGARSEAKYNEFKNKKYVTVHADALFNLSAEDFSKIVIAYEPVWAIGTGLTATSAQAQEMHAFIRQTIADKYGKEVADNTSILYGGSANGGNAKELFSCPDIDGGLIGGASLDVEKFIPVIEGF